MLFENQINMKCFTIC